MTGRTRLARLPEMRLAYLEVAGDEATLGPADLDSLWERFNSWRAEARPALGRVDIAAVGWTLDAEGPEVRIRACVPIRSDYDPPPPARTTFFPGGAFVYTGADDADELDAAAEASARWVVANGLVPRSGLIEVHQFHFNLEQHPAACGFLVARPDGGDPAPGGGGHTSPLPIAR